MQPVVVLVHSSLVGPVTWAAVSRELRKRGTSTVLPVLSDHRNRDMPYWVQHAAAVAQHLEPLPADGVSLGATLSVVAVNYFAAWYPGNVTLVDALSYGVTFVAATLAWAAMRPSGRRSPEQPASFRPS